MKDLIKKLYESTEFSLHMTNCAYMHFVKEDPTSVRKYSNITLPEFTDLGWVYMSIANIFEGKLSSAERIILGMLMSRDPVALFEIPMEQRDKLQLANALKSLQDYKEFGRTDIPMELDMATSALILMSAMYRCPATMGLVGLSSNAKTIEERIREPVSDSYTELYKKSVGLLPPSQQDGLPSMVDRKFFKGVCMENFYGSSTAIRRLPENLQETYNRAKEVLCPVQPKHHSWGMQAGAVLTERGITDVQYTCAMSGRNVGYTCTTKEHATVNVGGTEFDVSQTVEGEPHHLRLIANTVHSADSALLIPVYQAARDMGFNLFTTHDALNAVPSRMNQVRQLVAEAIVDVSMDATNPLISLAKQLDLPDPQVEPLMTWIQKLNMHNMMS